MKWKKHGSLSLFRGKNGSEMKVNETPAGKSFLPDREIFQDLLDELMSGQRERR